MTKEGGKKEGMIGRIIMLLNCIYEKREIWSLYIIFLKLGRTSKFRSF